MKGSSSNSEWELSMASIRVCPGTHSCPAVLFSRVQPSLFPAPCPRGDSLEAWECALENPAGAAGVLQPGRAAVVSVVFESLHFVLWPFLCPFSEGGWIPVGQDLRGGASFPPLPCSPQGSAWDGVRALHWSSIWMGHPAGPAR